MFRLTLIGIASLTMLGGCTVYSGPHHVGYRSPPDNVVVHDSGSSTVVVHETERVPIPGTRIYYISGLETDVFWYNGRYYWSYGPYWYVTTRWGGTWRYVASPPVVFLHIPPNHHKHYVVRRHPHHRHYREVVQKWRTTEPAPPRTRDFRVAIKRPDKRRPHPNRPDRPDVDRDRPDHRPPAWGRDRDKDDRPGRPDVDRGRSDHQPPAWGRDRGKDGRPGRPDVDRGRSDHQPPAWGRDRDKDGRPGRPDVDRGRSDHQPPAWGRDRDKDDRPGRPDVDRGRSDHQPPAWGRDRDKDKDKGRGRGRSESDESIRRAVPHPEFGTQRPEVSPPERDRDRGHIRMPHRPSPPAEHPVSPPKIGEDARDKPDNGRGREGRARDDDHDFQVPPPIRKPERGRTERPRPPESRAPDRGNENAAEDEKPEDKGRGRGRDKEKRRTR